MGSLIIRAFVFFIFLLPLKFCPVIAQTNWIRAAYYNNGRYGFPIANISSSLFTHLICTFALVNSTSYELSVSPADEEHFSSFTKTVKLKNPSVTTLLSVGGGGVDYSTFSSMVKNSSYRQSFINSSIKAARFYGFQGLEFAWNGPNTTDDMFYMGLLFQEWRSAISLEAANSKQSHLLLTARVLYSPTLYSASYPTEMIQQHLNWVHVLPCDSSISPLENLTAAHAPLYSLSGNTVNMDHGIGEWIHKGLLPHKLVMMLTFYGYAWMLQNSTVNGFGAPATRPALNIVGSGTATYKEIKRYIREYGPEVPVRYNSTYVVNYWTKDIVWIEFDDIEAIRAKISYAKKKKLLGYSVWQVSYDYNWVLSKTAAGVAIDDSSIPDEHRGGQNNKSPLLVILLSTTAAVSLLLVIFMMFYCWRKNRKIKCTTESNDEANRAATAADFSSNVPNLMEYTLCDLEAATNGFSIENKLGQGGYGTVYKGVLPNGQIIAIKKLSKTFTQEIEEFKNEVKLTAKLQHVNLTRVMGFCVDAEEQILVYEYVQNKSLDLYLFGIRVVD
ncbi:class V chitinase-like isoform X2 [Mangifera indica]|uniref:class V chitinase-like isoform X2 n=1 Tax=Mangifera indica TaxID=29780 RepID=UPI001CF9EC4C|nr:class V chitinase-like isoform X2 [Mangifera indica]